MQIGRNGQPSRGIVDRRMLVSSSTPATVAALFAYDFAGDRTHIALPRPEMHVVARFGASVPGGLDVHVLGPRERVVRKRVRGGQRSAMARLPLGAAESVLGAAAASLVGRIVPLEDLWGAATARQLADRLAGTRDATEAAMLLERAIVLRPLRHESARLRLVLDATGRLAEANVGVVAADLGVSERHLRRAFHETVGIGPKAYVKLARFHRALDAARTERHVGWAGIAAAAGYYDQAHLIAEFRAISGVTPRALLGELRAAAAVGHGSFMSRAKSSRT